MLQMVFNGVELDVNMWLLRSGNLKLTDRDLTAKLDINKRS